MGRCRRWPEMAEFALELIADQQTAIMMPDLHKNVHFHPMGIMPTGYEANDTMTFESMLQENGDIGKEITYFKVNLYF